MTANLTLDVIGTDTGTFTVYQDSDQYTTPVASGLTAAQLSTPYSLTTLDAATTTLRVMSSGSCNSYKDISVDFGDITPSITRNFDSAISPQALTSRYDRISYASDGLSRSIVVFGYYTGNMYLALATSASSWNFTTEAISIPGVTSCDQQSLIHDGSNFYMFIRDLSSSPFSYKIYRIDGFSGSDATPSASSLTFTLISDLGTTLLAGPYDYRYINNKYYIIDTSGVFRSSDNSTFTNVLPLPTGSISAKRKSIDNYGNTIFFCSDYQPQPNYGSFLYKSTDNGMNWSVVFNNGNLSDNGYLDGVFVEDLDNIILYKKSTSSQYVTNYFHSGDGGVTFNLIPFGNYDFLALDGTLQIIKHNSVYLYFHQNNNTSGNIAYVSGSFPSSLSARTNVSSSTYQANYAENHMFIVRDKLFCIYQSNTDDRLRVSTFTIANT